ncbi:hypothetical protein [Nocardioides antri]|uniref:Uncharacterized protein n=1 Tax=Nocardioides antri TaxID=2607659 RepID=A0A5B1M4Y8_9ACTN|nr:hypothetical protein [Nocardioides antri]KAA1427518.1 hypothetical protein F0U47_08625 [Nocardioides antri]
MGELDDIDFGTDSDTIRRWLAKRASYAGERGDPVRGGKHRGDPPPTVDPQSLTVPNTRAAGQDVLDALAAPEPPIAQSWPAPYAPEPPADPVETPASAADERFPTPPPRPGKDPSGKSPYASTPEQEGEVTSSRSTNAVFEPRTTAHNAMTALMVLAVAAVAGAAYLAVQERTTVSYGLVALMALLAVLVWAIRASTSVTELAIIRGQLELIRDGSFEIVDLASPYTPVLVEGRPGRRGWRVLIERHDRPLLEINASIVDPHHFQAVLQRIRPDLRQDKATPPP